MTTWPAVRTYEDQQLAHIKMPVGGIGTGCISFGGRGQLVDFELANQPAKDHNPSNCFFAVHLADDQGLQVTRVLERALTDLEFEGPHGSRSTNHGLPRFRQGSFRAAYPLGQVDLSDDQLPITASVQCFNPLVPQDADASGIPALHYRATITNTSDRPLTVSVCGSLSNFVGARDGVSVPHGNTFEEVASEDGTVLIGRSGEVDDTDEAYGTLSLATVGATASSRRLNWERLSWGDAVLDFWDDFDDDGQLNEATNGSLHPTASLVTTQTVEAGASATFTFAIGWHFPNRYGWHPQDHEPVVVGNYYTGQYADAADVLKRHANDWAELEEKTITFVRSVTDSDLPMVVQDAALSNLAVLKSPTCFRIADGTFLGWEGCNDHDGSCHGSCTHVWNYQYALESLFGDLAWSMREVEFVHSLDERGKMSFRVELPLQDRGTEWTVAAADGQMGAIVRLHRTWRLTGQEDKMLELYPAARKAMEFAWIDKGWDADADGVMEGCQHNTMDVEYYGPSGVNQSWYLAALACCIELAGVAGDPEFADSCRTVLASGVEGTDRRLFNGDYYQQEIIPAGSEDAIADGLRIRLAGDDPQGGSDNLVDPDMQIGSGCTSDQLVGHTMAALSGVHTGLAADHVSTALKSIVRFNQRDEFYDHFNPRRSYALADEKGLLVCTFPHGNRPRRPFPYAMEVWTGLEYSAALGLLLEGDRAAAERIVTDVRDRYDGRRRNPFNEVECGHHYVRSMASWGLVEAWNHAPDA